MIFSTNLGVAGLLYHFRLLLERKGGKEIPALSRLEFLENFFLLYQMQKTIPQAH